MANVIAIGQVVDVNKELAARGVEAKVHLHDACGRQTLSLEALDGGTATLETARTVVREFFAERGITLEFDSVEGINFWSV